MACTCPVSQVADTSFLNEPGWRVRCIWAPRKNAPDRLAIIWQEIGGPPVSVPSGYGYDTSVIRELLPYELGGTVELELLKAGSDVGWSFLQIGPAARWEFVLMHCYGGLIALTIAMCA